MKYAHLFILATVLLVSLVVAGTAWLRMNDFRDYQHQLARRAVDVTAAELGRQLAERREQVELFVADQARFIGLLAADPANAEVGRVLHRRIRMYFPGRFAFTIADGQGRVLVEDPDMAPGPLCLADLQAVAAGAPARVRLHPDPGRPHYDIVVPWRDGKRGGFFFISFGFDHIVKLLRLAAPPGQHLLLLRDDEPDLIEVTDEGVRGSLPRDGDRLAPDERARLIYSQPVPGTRWRLAALLEPDLLTGYNREVVALAGLVILLFAAYGAAAWWLLRRQDERRSRAEEALRNWKQLLEQANQELRQLAVTDELTGLPNRRQFYDLAEVEMKRARRNWVPLSLLVIDVDKFKDYNDTYGHKAGDECLRRVAQGIREVLKRPSDIVARYGGEEFVALLPDTPQVGAEQIAEAIREGVEALGIPHASSGVAPVVTVSVGVCGMDPGSRVELDELIQRADQALYRAKSEGRNRVACCPPV